MCILTYFTSDATIIKNDDSSLCYDVMNTHQNLKNSNFVILGAIFRAIVVPTYLEMSSPLRNYIIGF